MSDFYEGELGGWARATRRRSARRTSRRPPRGPPPRRFAGRLCVSGVLSARTCRAERASTEAVRDAALRTTAAPRKTKPRESIGAVARNSLAPAAPPTKRPGSPGGDAPSVARLAALRRARHATEAVPGGGYHARVRRFERALHPRHDRSRGAQWTGRALRSDKPPPDAGNQSARGRGGLVDSAAERAGSAARRAELMSRARILTRQ